MRKMLLSLGLALCLLPARAADLSVHFSPSGGCESVIVGKINNARSTVHMLAYVLTDEAIQWALISAAHRGVTVVVVVDGHHAPSKTFREALAAQRGTLLLDLNHRILHDKVIIVDGFWLLTGSFNFSRAAESYNAENLLTIGDATLASSYESEFVRHQSHSSPP